LRPQFPRVPKRIRQAVTEELQTYSRFLQENPEFHVDYNHLSLQNIRACLPVYVSKPPAPPRTGRYRRRTQGGTWFKPKRVAWRFFLETKKGVNLSVELHAGAIANPHHQLQYGEFVQHTFNSLQRAQRGSPTRRRRYSPRILSLPDLYFSALWLTDSRGRDLFSPLVSVRGSLRPGSFYTKSEILRGLTNRTAERRNAHQNLLVRREQSRRRPEPHSTVRV